MLARPRVVAHSKRMHFRLSPGTRAAAKPGTRAAANPGAARDPQFLIVLGTAQYDGRPQAVFAARLDHVLTWHRRYPEALVLTVGGAAPGDRFTEAAAGRSYLVKRGVDPGKLIATGTGTDTLGSLRALVERFPQLATRNVQAVIVTDPLHTARVRAQARYLHISAQVSGAPKCPVRFPRRSWWHGVAHEAGGLVVHAVLVVAGQRAAYALRSGLHRIEAWGKPSRRVRHDVLRGRETGPGTEAPGTKAPGTETPGTDLRH